MATDQRRTKDPVVEAYKKDIDRTLLRQNLARSLAERLAKLIVLQRLAAEARRAGRPRDLEVIAELEALLEERAIENDRAPGILTADLGSIPSAKAVFDQIRVQATKGIRRRLPHHGHRRSASSLSALEPSSTKRWPR